MFVLKDYLLTKMASRFFGRIWKCLIQGNASIGSLLGISYPPFATKGDKAPSPDTVSLMAEIRHPMYSHGTSNVGGRAYRTARSPRPLFPGRCGDSS